jgi:signal transduction histidine kinase
MTLNDPCHAHNTTLYHQIITDSQTGVAIFDPVRSESGECVDFVFSLINDAGAAILGKPAHELRGQPYLAYFAQAKSSGLFAIYKQVMDSGEPLRIAEQPYFADGVNGWFDMRIARYEDSLVVTFIDITAIKQIEISHQQQATFLSQLLHTSPSAIIAYEAIRAPETDGQPGAITDFRVVFFNEAYERVFEESSESISRRTFRERFQGETNADLFPFYAQLAQSGMGFQRERYYPQLDKWLDLTGTKLYDGFLIVVHDITIQKKQAEALRLMNQELVRSNESLQQFAYVASHDLQEPLRKILSFGDIVQNQYAPQLGEQGADYIGRMQSAAGRMQVLIRDILIYSRLTRQPQLFKTVDTQALIEGVLADLETSVDEKQAVVTVSQTDPLTGDELQLRQLFQNLISNALKFTRPGSVPHITISCRTVTGSETNMALPVDALTKRFSLIDVTDNGIGFEPQYATRIFQVFQRLHGRTNQYGGTGIGLAIVQKVVDAHNGYIQAEGRPGDGATFRVLLPIAD